MPATCLTCLIQLCRVRPDIRSIVYCVGIRYGAEQEFNFLLKQFLLSDNEGEAMRILKALVCTEQIWMINRLGASFPFESRVHIVQSICQEFIPLLRGIYPVSESMGNLHSSIYRSYIH